jgi:hypothetical protein
MKFILSAILLTALVLALATCKGTVSASALKGTMNKNNLDANESRQLHFTISEKSLDANESGQLQKNNKFNFINKPYGLHFQGDIANLGLPIVGLGRLILQEGKECSFIGFGNLNSTFIPVNSEDKDASCNYTFDPLVGQGEFNVVLPSLGPLAVSNYVFIMTKGGETIFFIEKKNGVFVMVAEQQ